MWIDLYLYSTTAALHALFFILVTVLVKTYKNNNVDRSLLLTVVQVKIAMVKLLVPSETQQGL